MNYGNIGTNSIELLFDGSYTDIIVHRTDGYSYNNIFGNSYIDSNVLSNKSYQYYITPYYNEISGNQYNTLLSTYTMSYISYCISGTITSSSIQLIIDGSYQFFTLSRNNVDLSYVATGKIHVDSGLLPNTIYNYNLISYNNSNIRGNSCITGSICTMPTLINVQYGTITSTKILLYVEGSYNSMYVLRSDGFNETKTDVSSNTYTSIVSPDVSYNFSVYVFNSAGVRSVNTITTLPMFSLPIIISVSFGLITTTTIDLSFNGIYDYITIRRNNGKYISVESETTTYNKNYIDTGLQPNNDYNYVITPYNAYNFSGEYKYTQYVYTLPQLLTVTYSDISTNSILLNYTGYYNYVSIYRNNIMLTTNIFGHFYNDISGIEPNMNYYYTLIPYNGGDISGSSISSDSIYTLPIINTFYYSIIQTNNITLNYTGSYNHINIKRNDGYSYLNITTTSFSDVYNLTQDLSYNYTITPYNTSGNSGTPIVTSIVYAL